MVVVVARTENSLEFWKMQKKTDSKNNTTTRASSFGKIHPGGMLFGVRDEGVTGHGCQGPT
jgi:hypothetical protein